MFRIIESKVAYVAVCLLFLGAISVSLLTGGTLPAFGEGLLPAPQPAQVSQSPFPPPSPDDPWLALAQSPFPPPSPDDPWLALAQSPFPPPSPDDPWLA